MENIAFVSGVPSWMEFQQFIMNKVSATEVFDLASDFKLQSGCLSVSFDLMDNHIKAVFIREVIKAEELQFEIRSQHQLEEFVHFLIQQGFARSPDLFWRKSTAADLSSIMDRYFGRKTDGATDKPGQASRMVADGIWIAIQMQEDKSIAVYSFSGENLTAAQDYGSEMQLKSWVFEGDTVTNDGELDYMIRAVHAGILDSLVVESEF